MRRVALLLVLVSVLSACAGGVRLSHTVTYTAKGTRSEARHGHLWIEGQELPWAFRQVAYDRVSYTLHKRSHLWGDDGYWPDRTAYVPPDAESPLPAESRSRGYHLGMERPAETPVAWLWVRWGDDRAAVVAPGRIDRLIREQQIPSTHSGDPGRRRLKP